VQSLVRNPAHTSQFSIGVLLEPVTSLWVSSTTRRNEMTELLKKAFDEASKLPQEQQDALASLLLEELRSDRAWAQSFARSQDALSQLADEADAEHQTKKSNRLDPSAL
jgi:hypothetical protein